MGLPWTPDVASQSSQRVCTRRQNCTKPGVEAWCRPVPPQLHGATRRQPAECSLDGSKMSAEQPSLSQTWWDSENVKLKST